jgi:GNAT superfamily N-acetyltransferase
MQIRIGNRQDQKRVQALTELICREFGRPFDLNQADQDLKNIELRYFGRDGIFLVVEEENQIVGLAGAMRQDEDRFVLRRICLEKPWRRKGLGRQLIKIVLSHAQRLGFSSVAIGDDPFQPANAKNLPASSEDAGRFFAACGFPKTENKTATGRLGFAPYVFTR